jgi:hypothetical protein
MKIFSKRTQLNKAERGKIIRIFLLILLCASWFTCSVYAASKSSYKEYEIKAAFIYNFMKFVSWEGRPEDEKTVTIGIVGKNLFGESFDPITEKKIKNKSIVIKEFGGFSSLQSEEQKTALKKCDLLFINASEEKNEKQIIDIVKNSCVLTVGETKGFLDSGGIIGFVTEKKKVRFEINMIAAEYAKLNIRAQLLRLARKVIKDQQQSKNDLD